MNTGSRRGKNSLKLLGNIRGDGVLHGPDGPIAVVVDAAEYEERGRSSITGGLEGDLSAFENGVELKLVLTADGRELNVRLIEPDDGGADFRTQV
ncbi:hypothetical protein BH09PSE2_BH09PSE2_15360 [soil metagenome]